MTKHKYDTGKTADPAQAAPVKKRPFNQVPIGEHTTADSKLPPGPEAAAVAEAMQRNLGTKKRPLARS